MSPLSARSVQHHVIIRLKRLANYLAVALSVGDLVSAGRLEITRNVDVGFVHIQKSHPSGFQGRLA